MDRIYNFSAGPAMLPVEVLKKAREELLNYNNTGMSVMEMSHRSKVYDEIIKETESRFRKVMNVLDNYKILFLQGGATLQFSMVPMNLLTKNAVADYIITGNFSKKAYEEATKYGKINIAGSTKDENFSRIPTQGELNLDVNADYVHLCTNNTIYGTTWKYIPQTGSVPIVSDMSSCILSEPVDVSKYGLIYAGAQKNMGPAGLTVVIIREDLAGKTLSRTPIMLDYSIQMKNESMYNTPPTYGIYILKLVLEWLEDLGGLERMADINQNKANILYSYLEESNLFKSTVAKDDRSMMNVTFVTGDADLDSKFIKEAESKGFANIKGHRVVGGMRASIYNAMPTEGVEALVEFMKKFEMKNR